MDKVLGLMRQRILLVNNYYVIIPCAGIGSRFGGDKPKQYQTLLDKPLLYWTLQPFINHPLITKIMIVVQPDDKHIMTIVKNLVKVEVYPYGGETRKDTVNNMLDNHSFNDNDWILVHDAARPCIREQDISNLITKLENDTVGGILANVATDTIKEINNTSKQIIRTINRNTIYMAQTPQMFRKSILSKALNSNHQQEITDEASAIELLNLPVKIVQCAKHNLKVTEPLDMLLAEIILSQT